LGTSKHVNMPKIPFSCGSHLVLAVRSKIQNTLKMALIMAVGPPNFAAMLLFLIRTGPPNFGPIGPFLANVTFQCHTCDICDSLWVSSGLYITHVFHMIMIIKYKVYNI